MIFPTIQRALGRALFPDAIWSGNPNANHLYLTFDDGPTPGITEYVLDLLDAFNAKATFFCLGKNVLNHPDLYIKILAGGHITGNHTHDHLNGWKTSSSEYLKNIELAEQVFSTRYFRPPYGRITLKQMRLVKTKFKCVMWDVLSRDYDENLNHLACIQLTINQTRAGSILVFHDSVKAWPRLEKTLPYLLKYYTDLGFKFKTIEDFQI